MSEGTCRCNPWADALLLCRPCEDTTRAASDPYSRETGPCPYCGTDERRSPLWRERNFQTMPKLKRSDLTADEEQQVKEWRLRGFHELDCLRWIEGARYKPEEDQAFLDLLDKALLKSAFLHEQPEPSFHAEHKRRT
jgi:hypothetical protein